MKQNISLLNETELVELYHTINAELKEQFLNRVPWEAQQEKINHLTQISKELMKRKTEHELHSNSESLHPSEIFPYSI